MLARFQNHLIRFIALLLGLWFSFDLASRLVAEVLWFQEVGYLRSFEVRLLMQGVLWAIAVGISASFLLGNLAIARRLKYPKPQVIPETASEGIGLVWLLPLALGLSLLLGILLTHYGQIAATYWHPNFSLPSVSPVVPTRFKPEVIWQIGSQWRSLWQLGLIGVLAIALILYPQPLLAAIAVAMSVGFGLVLSGHWGKILQYFHITAFNYSDPLFDQDVSFYVFVLPIWQLLEFWLIGLFLYGLVAVCLLYLLSGDSLSQGRFPGFTPAQQHHLSGLAGCLMLAVAFSFWLSRYELLYSSRGVAYGASYTDVHVQLPVNTGLSCLAVAIAIFLFWKAIFGTQAKHPYPRHLIYGLGCYLVGVAIAGVLLPNAVQRLVVQPNELVRERPYIERSIALTRKAFDLDNVEVETFDPQGQLTYADIQRNDLTIRNIRLWDTRPLLETNRQLQQIRLYYKFPDADIDRYTLKRDPASRTPPISATAEKQQVILAARELDYSAVPQQAQTWINKHLIYTHGYGFTLSPVNTVAPGGLPEYFVKDIGVGATDSSDGNLRTSSERIRTSIPIGYPRIYYGQITDTYVMTGTKTKELDYPSGNDNAYNSYNGQGGIALSPWWRRCFFAKYLNDWRMLLTGNFTPETKLLFRRNINQRIRAIAPFLRYDHDPYLVVADTDDGSTDQNYLYWVVDAYTTSDRYPYSDIGSEKFNYIRNSVKVVIDAYHGSVNFYVADPRDPIITTWSSIFPELFKSLDSMPAPLRSHIRYPADFFSIQSERLMTYHMTDPQVFYNREDQWQIPTEVYANEPRLVEPYYLITSLPAVPFEEFILLLPYTPKQRTNLIAWLAARSDGENYGKLLLYEFPKQQLVYGPEQIEARINQDPVISQQISLWNRQGSRAIQGNLLVIPIEQSLLYVEPIYLEAEQNSLPTLVRVVVAYENRIVMAETLEQALQAIFQSPQTEAPAIIRELEGPAPTTTQ